MSAPAASARRLRHLGVAMLVAALAAGIIAMHALSDHGATVGEPAAGHHAVAHHGAPAHEPAPDPDDHHSESGVMVCLMMLAAAGGLLLARRLARTTRPLFRTPVLRRSETPAPWRGRFATGPPPAWQFSVVRC